MNGASAWVPMSYTARMFGWFSAAAARASCSNRWRRSASAENAIGQDLDRDVATQPRVARAVDVAHAARANQRDDFIGAEPRAGGEGHGATLILRVAPGPAKGKGRCVQFAIKPFRSDCQQISAHPIERNASWMSARLSYRTRRRRN